MTLVMWILQHVWTSIFYRSQRQVKESHNLLSFSMLGTGTLNYSMKILLMNLMSEACSVFLRVSNHLRMMLVLSLLVKNKNLTETSEAESSLLTTRMHLILQVFLHFYNRFSEKFIKLPIGVCSEQNCCDNMRRLVA